ncbi:DUF4604 domain-containing protein [Mycena indigotica]|uniref:DUF4604 domain-containing protein n=1 Tax=Mycena indigotica TaxID=2126181 RepID=A0A8H6W6Z0_9AGAR|nr:DUF4604 domain-containing protein [Mycena indigotica]KAF7307142.1 DUF4604 domain-containing protein [Mycena indigotica]
MAPPKEPTRAQLSSRLTYSQTTPRFLQKLQNRVAGIPDEDDEQDDEYETLDNSGRPPIPRRPPIPERPADDPGSADEDDADERPQVVVLKEGKHLSEREAENIRRKEKGLQPLPDPDPPTATSSKTTEDDHRPKKVKPPPPSLSFSTAKNGFKAGAAKRKAILNGSAGDLQPAKKKAKKDTKTLLSFGDEA